MRRSLVAAATVLTLAATLAAACSDSGGEDEDAAPEPERKPKPVVVQPLTGLPDTDGSAQTRPAMFVKIDNADFEGTRPQTGLEQADVVYEEVVEFPVTRFNAVFNSRVPEPVGPIRSVRAMDTDIVWPLGGVFVFSGGTEGNVALIGQAPVTVVDENNAGDAFFRNDDKQAPHNLFGHGEALFAFGGQPVPPPPLFAYLGENNQFKGDEPVATFRVGFEPGYAPTYTWDEATGTWLRDIDGEPFMSESGQQLAPTNVIVQFIEYAGGGEGVILGEGDAWAFVDGQVIRGRWVRPVREQVTQFVTAFGKKIKLEPGSTWVEFAEIGDTVDVFGPAPAAPPPAPPG